MTTRSKTILDSSLHQSCLTIPPSYRDPYIRTGVVRRQLAYTSNIGETSTRYSVDVNNHGKEIPVTCSIMSRFGGPFNYEEWSDLVWDGGKDKNSASNYIFRAGDVVLVALINGQPNDGVILGCLKHPARKEKIARDKSTAYISEFNGIETSINKDGEFKQVFKGTPTNLSKLTGPCSGTKIPEPIYDEKISGSYYSWSKDGSYMLSDNAKENPQIVKIDKPNGKITITSGKTILTIDKKEESYSIINKKTTVASADQFTLTTKKTTINSKDLFELQATDVKVKGKVEQTGDVKVIGDIKQTGNTEIMGDFKTQGMTKLAGGANALVYDILLISGSGNLGCPVISTAIMLKTVMTKAT